MALSVQPSDVAPGLGLDPLALTATQETTITEGILDAEAAVMNHLNRDTLEAVPETVTGQHPDGRYPVTDWRAWAHLMTRFDDLFTVASATLDADGSYTVVFNVGLDAATTPQVKRYIVAHAAEAVRENPGSTVGQRRVSAYSAEGQSIRYESTPTGGAGAPPGALPTLESLNRWRRHGVYRSNRPARPPWPMTGNPVGWDPR